MEAGGFRIKVDLSQFFSDIKKFSCIYVDLSRDRQIADVIDRISELFCIERPLCLLDEKYYLPESENVNVLRDSNVVTVLNAFHLKSNEHCSTTDRHAKNATVVEYLRHENHPEQVPVKNNNTDMAENFSSCGYYQNGEVASSSVYHTGKDVFHELCGKKRKHEEFDESKYTNSHINIMEQDSETEIHYQKKCKRKKERVKKGVLNGSSLKHLEDELEEKSSDGINFDTKNNRKKKKNKAGLINGDITEDKVVSVVPNHSALEIVSEHSEQATCDSRSLYKCKEKRKEDLPSQDTHKTHDSKLLLSKDSKKHKKKLSQTTEDTEVAQDQSLLLSLEKNNMKFLTSCSQNAQKCENESTLMCQNIDALANSGIENDDSITFAKADFAHRSLSNTPIFSDGRKIKKVVDFLLQNNAETHDSSLGNHLDSAINTVFSTKPKRNRVRVRKHRKRNNIKNDNVVSLPSVILQHAEQQSNAPLRKHIRFEEEVSENLKEKTSHKEVDSYNEMNIRNKTTEGICGSKDSPDGNVECTQELTAETEVTDCLMENSFEYSIPKNLVSKNNTASWPQQIPLHQRWASNTENLSSNSKESFQKLLTLGKQNSVPVVFERKNQCNNSGAISESSTPVLKQNSNKSDEETCHFQSSTEVVDITDTVSPEMHPSAIDPLHYPQLEGKPRKNDLIAFKMLKMTSDYTPEVSGFIIAKVLSISEDTLEMVLQIQVGESHLEAPKGRFYLENEDSEKNDSDSKLRQLNWNELMDVRILFP